MARRSKVENVLRGVSRSARVLPSRCYKHDGVIHSDEEVSHEFKHYMLDLFARRLQDRVTHGEDCPDLEGKFVETQDAESLTRVYEECLTQVNVNP